MKTNNPDIIKYISDNFNLDKLSLEFNLKEIENFRDFFIRLFLKGIIPNNYESVILNGFCEISRNQTGLLHVRCGYWENSIYWDRFSLKIQRWNDSYGEKELISNIEIMAFKEYILEI